jgi:mono/diheme cytochrome c family protein
VHFGHYETAFLMIRDIEIESRMSGERFMGRMSGSVAVALLVLAASGTAAAAEDRGAYLAHIMDCGGCHTAGYLMGKPDMAHYLGGGDIAFEIPGLGIFYPPNITGDQETGVGGWSEAEIVAAVTEGKRPDGRILAPIMPYHSFAALTPADARALAHFLKTGTTPVSNKVPGPIGPGEKAPGPYMTIVAPK